MFRVQSLYLLISSVINFVLMVFINYYDFQDNLMDIYRVVAAGSGIFLLFLIFLYKNKNLQLKMMKIFNVVYVIFGFYIAFFIDLDYSSFFVFGLLSACIFCSLATKYIKKDIELINSADRLR
ncbi:MAG: DUF4293 family protein [Cryomorphaceae bacterium]|nr:MAG: DUF4293 family protein [Cryomorphaceae bacterium]